MAARRKRAPEEEEHVNHERWLLTYADMITLLMVLFIVLFAIGQTDLKKFELLKHSLSNSLGGQAKVLSGGSGALDGQLSSLAGLNLPGPIGGPNAAAEALAEKQHAAAVAAAEQSALTKVEETIQSALAAHGLDKAVSFKLEGRGLVVTVVTDKVLFDVGSATLRPEGHAVLDAMAPSLRALPNEIAIEGHTDDTPISDGQYPSNWELSTFRASEVLRYLVVSHGLDPRRLSAAGYADQRPLVPNDSDAHRATNRRVAVVVESPISTGKAG